MVDHQPSLFFSPFLGMGWMKLKLRANKGSSIIKSKSINSKDQGPQKYARERVNVIVFDFLFLENDVEKRFFVLPPPQNKGKKVKD